MLLLRALDALRPSVCVWRVCVASCRTLNWDSISSASDSFVGGLASHTSYLSTSDSNSDSESDTLYRRPRTFVEPPIATKAVAPSCVANEGLRAIEPPHVLVVEDTEMCATVVRILLHKLGCSSDHAENGAQAVEMLKRAEAGLYSLVLMDLRMPTMDGFEATAAIRQQLQLDVPVVALTADETFGTREKCVSVGFSDFAPKPLKYDALATMLQKHTGHVVMPANLD